MVFVIFKIRNLNATHCIITETLKIQFEKLITKIYIKLKCYTSGYKVEATIILSDQLNCGNIFSKIDLF